MKIKFLLNSCAVEKIIEIDPAITDDQIKNLFIDFVHKNGGGYEFSEHE